MVPCGFTRVLAITGVGPSHSADGPSAASPQHWVCAFCSCRSLAEVHMRALARSAASSSRWRPQASCLQSLARIHGRHLTTEAASSWQTEGTGTEFGFVVEPNELESAEVLQQLQHLELNEGFWGRFRNIPQMAKATEKEDRHVFRYKAERGEEALEVESQRSLDDWTAPELAALCRSFAELGYLQDRSSWADPVMLDSLVGERELTSGVVTQVHSLVEAVTKQTLLRLDEFEASQLCLHASSYRRLNLCNALSRDGTVSNWDGPSRCPADMTIRPVSEFPRKW
eukprot:g13488.t1